MHMKKQVYTITLVCTSVSMYQLAVPKSLRIGRGRTEAKSELLFYAPLTSFNVSQPRFFKSARPGKRAHAAARRCAKARGRGDRAFEQTVSQTVHLGNSRPRETLDFPRGKPHLIRTPATLPLHTLGLALYPADKHVLDAAAADFHAFCVASCPALLFDSHRSALIAEANATAHTDWNTVH